MLALCERDGYSGVLGGMHICDFLFRMTALSWRTKQ